MLHDPVVSADVTDPGIGLTGNPVNPGKTFDRTGRKHSGISGNSCCRCAVDNVCDVGDDAMKKKKGKKFKSFGIGTFITIAVYCFLITALDIKNVFTRIRNWINAELWYRWEIGEWVAPMRQDNAGKWVKIKVDDPAYRERPTRHLQWTIKDYSKKLIFWVVDLFQSFTVHCEECHAWRRTRSIFGYDGLYCEYSVEQDLRLSLDKKRLCSACYQK